jgi:hypothetical protein
MERRSGTFFSWHQYNLTPHQFIWILGHSLGSGMYVFRKTALDTSIDLFSYSAFCLLYSRLRKRLVRLWSLFHMGTMQDSIMDSTVQNLQTLQHLAGLNTEREPHSVPAGDKELSCLCYGDCCLWWWEI